MHRFTRAVLPLALWLALATPAAAAPLSYAMAGRVTDVVNWDAEFSVGMPLAITIDFEPWSVDPTRYISATVDAVIDGHHFTGRMLPFVDPLTTTFLPVSVNGFDLAYVNFMSITIPTAAASGLFSLDVNLLGLDHPDHPYAALSGDITTFQRIPEPSSLLLVGLGALTWLGRRRIDARLTTRAARS